MRLLHVNSDEMRLRLADKELWRRSFLFDFSLVPRNITPKHVVIERQQGKKYHEFKMAWRKFVKQRVIEDTILIDKSEFAHFENGVKVSGRMTWEKEAQSWQC